MGFELGSTLWQDIRYGVRLLSKTPTFSAIAVLTLALGIGANTAIFSLIDAVMLRVLPVSHPEQLAVLQWSANARPKIRSQSSYGDTGRPDIGKPGGTSFSRPFLQEVEKAGVFSGIAAFANAGPLEVSGNGPASSARGQVVTGDFFSTLGVRPALGRLLQPSDDAPSASPVIVLNHLYWQTAFAGAPDVVGKTLRINGISFTIVGVADPQFLALSFGNVYDLWMPMHLRPQMNQNFIRGYDNPQSWWIVIVGRLKPEVPISQAQATLDTVFRNHMLHGDTPLSKEADSPRLRLLPAQEALVGSSGQYRDPLRVLMVAVGIVLLIACSNVAGLVLSRATGRRREIAVRLALGARRSRLLRQLLTESVLLSIAGGVLGMIFAWWGARAMVAMIAGSQDRPMGLSASIDARVLLFTAGVSMLSGILFGLAPALRSLRVDLTPALKEGAAASAGTVQAGHRWLNLGNALIAVQTALAIVVLAGAGLMVHTVSNLKNLDPGFDTRNLLTFRLDPQLAGYKDRDIDTLYTDLQPKIAALPGVVSVSYSESALLGRSWSRTEFRYVPPGESKAVRRESDWMPISPDFFSTLKIPFVAGRMFTSAEYEQAAVNNALERARRGTQPGPNQPPAPTAPIATVVNRTFVKKYLPNVNPIGQHFGFDDGSDPDRPDKNPGYYIVGVVGDAKYESLRREIDATMYVPLVGSTAVFELRTAGDPKALIAPLRALVNQRDSNLPLLEVKTQSELVEALVSREKIIAKLSSLFGMLALTLACIGLYGLLSYEVTRRTREIGIRMALGARRGDLIRLVVSRGVALVVAGIAIGVAAALAVGRLMNSLLYGVKADDPVTLVAVTVLLLAVALFAAFVPARRASTVNPVVALRYE